MKFGADVQAEITFNSPEERRAAAYFSDGFWQLQKSRPSAERIEEWITWLEASAANLRKLKPAGTVDAQ